MWKHEINTCPLVSDLFHSACFQGSSMYHWLVSNFKTFKWLNKILLYVCIHFIYLFIRSWLLLLFPHLAIVDNATINISIQMSIWVCFQIFWEGNGNPLQCSCLENPRDRGAWWAAIYGVTQNRTRLKWLSIASNLLGIHIEVELLLLLFSVLVMSDILRPHGLLYARLPCPSLSPRVCSDSCSLSWLFHPTISFSFTHFSSCLQSFPASVFHNHKNLTKMIKWTTVLCNLMNLWAIPCRATQDRWVTAESSDKTWSTEEGNSKPFQHSCLENPMNSMKRIAWSYVIQCLAFRGTNKLFSAVAALFNIPTAISIQFSSVAQSCLTLCDPINCSMPGLPVHHQLPEFTQTHIPWVSDVIQPSHPLSSPSPPVPNPSQHQSLFQWVNFSHEVAKVLEFQL